LVEEKEMQIFVNANYDFLGKKYIALASSLLVILVGFIFLIRNKIETNNWLNYGIDFAGGTLIQVRFAEAPSTESLRAKIEALKLGDTQINTFGDRKEFLIRIEGSTKVEISTSTSEERKDIDKILEKMSSQVAETLRSPADIKAREKGMIDLNNVGRQRIIEALQKNIKKKENNQNLSTVKLNQVADKIKNVLETNNGIITDFDQLKPVAGNNKALFNLMKETFYLGSFAVKRVEMVGPKVGADLRRKAVGAIASAMVGILIYITFRFKFLSFGIGAIVALIHDVFVTTFVFAMSGGEFNLPIIAALLTIVGYSLNDTIVIFDRIRDNLKLLRREPLPIIINKSINQTLSRTILTSFTTLLVVICLFLMGSEVIKPFAFALFVGIITGTYSTIYIASPIILLWQKFSKRQSKKL
jgi:preprotein translocase subunit SecF